jgi:CBS domain-containing protein
MSEMIARICERNVDTIRCDESVVMAADRMRQRTVGALVVVNEYRQPIGILTDRDLVVRVVADRREETASVSEVMTPDPVVVSEETTISAALLRMRKGTFRRLPVVDGKGTLVGIVTLDDILMSLSRELGEIRLLLECETPRAAAMASGAKA